MKKIFLIIIFIIVAAAIIFSLRFILGGDEDTWLCQDGQWIKHGQPSAPQPTQACPEQ